MKKNIMLIFIFLIVFDVFPYEIFNGVFGITFGMTRKEIKTITETENWLLKNETETELYFMPSIERSLEEGFFGTIVPEIVFCFDDNDSVSSFIIATGINETDSLEDIIEKIDEKYGLEFMKVYKEEFLVFKMIRGGHILQSWSTSRNLLTGETSKYVQFTITRK